MSGKCFNNESTYSESGDKKNDSWIKYASSEDEFYMNEEVDVLNNEYEPQNEDEILKIAEVIKCEAEQTNIRDELKTMSFEQLMKLKEKLGSKLYNEAVFGISETKRDVKYKFARETSNRPMEISSKRQVPYGGTKKADELIADPRFNANCGVFNSTKFKKKYEFVNDMRESELKTLNMKLKNCVDTDEANRIKFLIQRLKNQLHEEKKRKEKLTNIDNQTERIGKRIDSNKKPFFIKSNLKKTEQMVKQYEELQQSGKLSKHLEKRRKKSMIKDRKKCTVL